MTEANILEVERLAGYFFSPEQIVLIIGLSKNDKHDHKFKTAYQRGKLLKEAEVRKSIIDLAVNGSSPAQVLAVKFIEQSKLDEE